MIKSLKLALISFDNAIDSNLDRLNDLDDLTIKSETNFNQLSKDEKFIVIVKAIVNWYKTD